MISVPCATAFDSSVLDKISVPFDFQGFQVRRKVVESGQSTEWCTMPKLCCVRCTHMSKIITIIVHHNLSLLTFKMCGVWLFYTQLYQYGFLD